MTQTVQTRLAQSRTRHIWPSLVLCLSFLATFVLTYRTRFLATDDSYIHRRIAVHYAATGFGWFNVTERVMGTSSLMWTLLLGSTYRILGDYEWTIPLLEALCLSLCCLAAYRLAELETEGNASGRWASTVPILAAFVTWAILLETATSQMETPLALAFLLWGFVGHFYKSSVANRLHVGTALLVLAIFTRLELIVFLPFALIAVIRQHRYRWDLSVGAVTALLCSGWQMYQYGTLIPNTIAAKAVAYQHLTFRSSLETSGLTVLSACAFVMLLTSFLFLLKPWHRRAGIAAPSLLLGGGFVILTLYCAKRTLIFPWYTPLYLLPLSLGLLLLARRTRSVPIWTLVLLMLLLLDRGNVGLVRHITTEATLGHRPRDGKSDAQAARVHEYLRVGNALAHSCPHATLLTSEIGGLGYAYPGRVVDGLGLVSPEAIAYHPLKFPEDSPSGADGAIPPRFAAALKPDMIASYEVFSEVILRDAGANHYQDFSLPPFPAKDFTPSNYLGRMHVLVRDGGACSVKQVGATLHEKGLDDPSS